MISAGIIGGTGYTAGELIWILLHHPSVALKFVYSNSQSGKAVTSVHTELKGETDLKFSNEVQAVDVVFLCLPHGKAKEFLQEHPIGANTKIIDLSNDYRLGLKLGEQAFTYGLPELNKKKIKESTHVANPGCFATGIQLALLPLAKAGLLKQEVHITAITGSTGAGAGLSATTHFSWRSSNLSVYKAFEHQHLGEIKQSLQQLDGGFAQRINFVPMRGDFPRGIFSSIYTSVDLSLDAAYELYEQYYQHEPFVVLSREDISLKEGVNTNRCLLQLQRWEDKLLIVSAVDNLLKGASGQAVQNLNLMFGLEETAGLKLKPIKF